MLPGLRGVGKTVLLRRFTDLAESQSLEAVMLESSEEGRFPALLARHLRGTLVRLQHSRTFTNVVRRSLAAFKGFTISAGLDGSLSFGINVDPEAGLADSGNLEFDLSDLFVALGESARERKTALLIAIDEMQYLSEAELGAFMKAYHRSTQLNLPVAICGAGLPNLKGMVAKAKTYAERQFQWFELGALSLEEVGEAINGAANPRGVEFAADAIEEIYSAARGYPFFVQEWAHDAWNAAPGPLVTAADVHKSRDTVHRRLQGFFGLRYERCTPKERLYLHAMAELGAGPHESGAVAQAYGTTVTAAASVRDALIRKGLLYSSRSGETAFTVPAFDEFLRHAGDTKTLSALIDTKRRGRQGRGTP